MKGIDQHEVAMYSQKWEDVWFFVKNNKNYFAGKLGQAIYHLDQGGIIVNVTLFHSHGYKVFPLWITFGGQGHPTFTTFNADTLEEYYVAHTKGTIYQYTSSGVVVRSKRIGRRKTLKTSVKLHLDFSFPDPGLVTMNSGIYKGCTHYIFRNIHESQKRGCVPGHNLSMTLLDDDLIVEEGLPFVGDLPMNIVTRIIASLYHSLVYTKPLTLEEGIAILKEGQHTSIALNKQFALMLSKKHEGFDLLHGTAEIGRVTSDGVVTIFDIFKDHYNDFLAA